MIIIIERITWNTWKKCLYHLRYSKYTNHFSWYQLDMDDAKLMLKAPLNIISIDNVMRHTATDYNTNANSMMNNRWLAVLTASHPDVAQIFFSPRWLRWMLHALPHLFRFWCLCSILLVCMRWWDWQAIKCHKSSLLWLTFCSILFQ